MKLKLLPLIALAAAACGGTASTSTQEFQNAAPSYDNVALSQNDGDTAAPATADGSPSAALTDSGSSAATSNECHPHLFDRSRDVMARVNRHFWKQLHHVQDLIEDTPKLASGETHTWENVKEGIDRKFTITKTVNADASVTYSFELDLSAVGGTAVKVMDGSITHIGSTAAADAGASADVETKGTIHFDYDKLASVVTTEKARGQITDTFDHLKSAAKGEKRTAQVTLANFVADSGGNPRSGTFSWLREPSKGGLFTFTDSFTATCSATSVNAVADLTAAARWYKAADGSVHGRTDAKLTGGGIPSGDAYLGVTCAQGQTTAAPAEGFWAVKLENSSTGATVNGTMDQTGATPCDAALGTVPGSTWLQGNTADFDFNATVTFPGEF